MRRIITGKIIYSYENYANNRFTTRYYNNGITRIIDGYNKANGRNNLQKRGIGWLEDQLKSNGWSVAKFYEIPSNKEVININ